MEPLLAGLQSGTYAALVMLAWLAAASIYYRRTVWAIPNLFATTFHGASALRRDFGSTTVSGLALHLLIYALLGALFGLLVQDRATRLRTTLLGMIWGVLWYYAWFNVLWTAINPLIPLYVPDRPMLVGHLIYGGLLGRTPAYLREMRLL
jgi:hypothetical protein